VASNQSALGITISRVAHQHITASSASAGCALGFPAFGFRFCLHWISAGASGKLIVESISD
jgi:hypothetical protein